MKIVYQAGLAFEGEESLPEYEQLVSLSDYEPLKHELFAHLLMMAVRMEWREADRLRKLERQRQLREQKRQQRSPKAKG